MIQPVKEKIILGIDPGTTIMGYGVLRVQGTKPEMIAMGIIDLRKMGDHYLKLRHIHERVLSIIESYLPDELAIEAPFFGKNVQSMLKLGRAQGVAMAAALSRDIPITEYAPLKIKMAITGNGQASKEQVADMLQRMLHFAKEDMPTFMDPALRSSRPSPPCRPGPLCPKSRSHSRRSSLQRPRATPLPTMIPSSSPPAARATPRPSAAPCWRRSSAVRPSGRLPARPRPAPRRSIFAPTATGNTASPALPRQRLCFRFS